MADFVDHFKSFLTVKKVDEDNVVFKLYSKVSVGLCFLSASLVIATQYVGEKIHCDHKLHQIDDDLFNSHCWIHGSRKITGPLNDPALDCISEQDNLRDKPDDFSTVYYQWVVFVLIFNGVLFMVPRQLWKILEGGLMDEFGFVEAKSILLVSNPGTMNELADKYVRYFESIRSETMSYFIKFLTCELLNFAVLVANFVLTDKFLSGNFSTYGSDVINYFLTPLELRTRSYNPMCNAFPTKVSCTLNNMGVARGNQTISGMCILPQNIINEKIFLLLWFWYVFLMVVTCIYLTIKMAFISIPILRQKSILSRLKSRLYCERVSDFFKHKCSIGDWFLLLQISKNTNKYLFTKIIEELVSNHDKDDLFILN